MQGEAGHGTGAANMQTVYAPTKGYQATWPASMQACTLLNVLQHRCFGIKRCERPPPPVAMAAPAGAGVPANAPPGPGAGAVAGALAGAGVGAFTGAPAQSFPVRTISDQAGLELSRHHSCSGRAGQECSHSAVSACIPSHLLQLCTPYRSFVLCSTRRHTQVRAKSAEWCRSVSRMPTSCGAGGRCGCRGGCWRGPSCHGRGCSCGRG